MCSTVICISIAILYGIWHIGYRIWICASCAPPRPAAPVRCAFQSIGLHPAPRAAGHRTSHAACRATPRRCAHVQRAKANVLKTKRNLSSLIAVLEARVCTGVECAFCCHASCLPRLLTFPEPQHPAVLREGSKQVRRQCLRKLAASSGAGP